MSDFEEILMYAFRYSLGRQTFAGLTFTGFALKPENFEKLSEFTKNLMIKEIEEAIAMGRIDSVDLPVWMNFKGKLEK